MQLICRKQEVIAWTESSLDSGTYQHRCDLTGCCCGGTTITIVIDESHTDFAANQLFDFIHDALDLLHRHQREARALAIKETKVRLVEMRKRRHQRQGPTGRRLPTKPKLSVVHRRRG